MASKLRLYPGLWWPLLCDFSLLPRLSATLCPSVLLCPVIAPLHLHTIWADLSTWLLGCCGAVRGPDLHAHCTRPNQPVPLSHRALIWPWATLWCICSWEMFYVHLKVIFLQRRFCVYLLRTAPWRRLYQFSVEMLNTDCSQSCSQHAPLWQSCLLASAGRLTPFSLGSSSKDFWLLGWLQSVCPLSITTLSPTCPTQNRQGHRCCPCFPPYLSLASFSWLFWLDIPHPQLRSSLYLIFLESSSSQVTHCHRLRCLTQLIMCLTFITSKAPGERWY